MFKSCNYFDSGTFPERLMGEGGGGGRGGSVETNNYDS